MAALDAMAGEHRDRLRATALMHQVTESVQRSVAESVQRETDRVLEALAQDVRTDREVATAIRELVQTLRAPVQRTCTLHLSTGPVTVTVHEQRT
jgi:hypothetical protein